MDAAEIILRKESKINGKQVNANRRISNEFLLIIRREFAITVHLCRSGWRNRRLDCMRDDHRRVSKKIQ